MTIYDRTYTSMSFEGCDLSGDELSGAFVDVDFSGADLRGAILSGTFFSCDFSGADLTGAYFPEEKRFGNTF